MCERVNIQYIMVMFVVTCASHRIMCLDFFFLDLSYHLGFASVKKLWGYMHALMAVDIGNHIGTLNVHPMDSCVR